MKKHAILLAILLGVALPAFLFDREVNCGSSETIAETEAEEAEKTQIMVKFGDDVCAMDMETYIVGVVMGEMPASFESEALKAQAVATRTYTLRKILKQGKHTDADVCTDASCCQAYISKGDYLSFKGTQEDAKKIELAVHDTQGEVLTYQGELIEATYFSCSGGVTEDAVAVWGIDVPYLSSVASPGESQSEYYETEKVMSTEDFLSALDLPISASLKENDISITHTDGNGVETMTLFGATYTGTQLRKVLNLPSTAFSISMYNGQVTIVSKGYGHRVGMSQYGADAMAVNGSNYVQILLHYYKGTTLCRLTEKELNGLFDKAGNI